MDEDAEVAVSVGVARRMPPFHVSQTIDTTARSNKSTTSTAMDTRSSKLRGYAVPSVKMVGFSVFESVEDESTLDEFGGFSGWSCI